MMSTDEHSGTLVGQGKNGGKGTLCEGSGKPPAKGRIAYFHGSKEVSEEAFSPLDPDESDARFVADEKGDRLACPFCQAHMEVADQPMEPHMRDYGLALR